MRITVTGGKGFIGSATADAAEAAGHELRFFDRRDGNDIMGPLDALEGSEAVIHLAGAIGTMELFDTVQAAIDLNISGSYRVMDWCLRNNARYVGILVPSVFPSVYRATKDATRQLATALHHSKGLQVSHVRTFNAYGPGQAFGGGHPRKFMPTFAVNAWAGRPIPVWGDGNALVDPVHVSDVGRILVEACGFVDDQVFDAGTGTTVTVNDLAERVLKVTGSEGGVKYEPMRVGEPHPADDGTGHPYADYGPNIAAQGDGWGLLGWHPSFSWADVDSTIEWYRGREVNGEVPAGLR